MTVSAVRDAAPIEAASRSFDSATPMARTRGIASSRMSTPHAAQLPSAVSSPSRGLRFHWFR